MRYWALFVLGIAIILVGCQRRTVAEYKDIQFFKTDTIQSNGQQKIRISGLVFNSGGSVREIQTEAKGTAITVLVIVGPAKPGQSGSFTYDLSLQPSTEEVRFGKNEVVVWRRSTLNRN